MSRMLAITSPAPSAGRHAAADLSCEALQPDGRAQAQRALEGRAAGVLAQLLASIPDQSGDTQQSVGDDLADEIHGVLRRRTTETPIIDPMHSRLGWTGALSVIEVRIDGLGPAHCT
jgi:hypothetical protein